MGALGQTKNEEDKTMNRPVLLAGSLAMLLQLPFAYADEEPDIKDPPAASVDELGGVGAGAVVGALLGGPIGAILGGVGGGMLVQADTQQQQAAGLVQENTTLHAELEQTRSELAALRSAHAQLTAARMQQVKLVEQRPPLAPDRVEGFAMNVQFRRDSDKLETHFAHQLQQFARSFAGIEALHVHLVGHADRDGSDRYNDKLSQRRLEAVSAILVKAGWPATRIHEYAQGEHAPLVSEQDREGYAFDRRVVIRLGKAGEGV